MIPLSSPDITKKERKAVLEVLKTSTLSLGPRVEEFEKRVAKLAHRNYAIAVNSGTSALHLAVRALGIGKGDEVVTTPFSFIASANCILYEGAKPIFADIEEKAMTIDPKELERRITKKTKAIVVVDVFGHPAQWSEILRIAKKHHVKVIADSAESLGSFYKGKPCGSFGDVAIFSFYPNKQITTGEGGVILTNNKKIADLCWSMTNQGRATANGKWLEHIRLGYNYRMTEMQAALGLAQLERLPELSKKRKRVAELYTKKLKTIPGVGLPRAQKHAKVNWFVYVVRLAKRFSKKERDRAMLRLAEKGIQCGNYFQTIHLQPFYKRFGYKRGDYPIAEAISDRTIALPFYNNLRQKDIEEVVGTLKHLLLKL